MNNNGCYVRAYFFRFCRLARIACDLAHPFKPLPNLNAVTSFPQWLCRTKIGRLDPKGKITINSLESYWRSFKLLVFRQTGLEYSPESKMEIDKVGTRSLSTEVSQTNFAKHITHGIAKREGLVSTLRKKSLANRTVVENILDFLWKYDEFTYD